MLETIKCLALLVIDNIDAGNSHISEKELLECVEFFLKILSPELSKLESAKYIGVCSSTFDNYVKKGLIPEGHHKLGQNSKLWYKSDLNKYLKK